MELKKKKMMQFFQFDDFSGNVDLLHLFSGMSRNDNEVHCAANMLQTHCLINLESNWALE